VSNREKRTLQDSLHLFLAVARTKDGMKADCMRHVIKDYDLDLEILKHKLSVFGGVWRVYKTVNARCPHKAAKLLMHSMIDHPEKNSVIDSEWRTALMNPAAIYGQKRFMLDIDTKYQDKISEVENILGNNQVEVFMRVETPNGWHYITKPFDTREVVKLGAQFDDKGNVVKPGYVSLLRDGYYFVTMFNFQNTTY